MLNSDLIDLLRALNDERVKYLIVGAYATIHYTEPRFTKDLDIWVEPTPNNAKRVWKALAKFDAPLENVSIEDFENSENVFQIGVEPNRVDILMGIEGISFGDAWRNRTQIVFEGVNAFIIGIEDLIKNKEKVGRLQDQIDVERLKRSKEKRGSSD